MKTTQLRLPDDIFEEAEKQQKKSGYPSMNQYYVTAISEKNERAEIRAKNEESVK